MAMWKAQAVVALVAMLLVAVATPRGCHARIHDLAITTDERVLFAIETFGFNAGGTIKLDMNNFQATGEAPYKIGFFIREVESQSESMEFIQEAEDTITNSCPLTDDNTLIDLSDKGSWKAQSIEHTIDEAGMYVLVFARCTPLDGSVTFQLRADLYNQGLNFLSAGNMPLPTMYLAFSVLFFLCLALWIVHVRRNRAKSHTVHHMMTVLVIFKALSLLFESFSYFHMKAHGRYAGWNILFYIFTFVKGMMLFVVVLLIGTGWSLLKPFLNDREKRIFFIVLPLQVIANIAIIVVDESAPGSIGVIRWRNVLHIIDIVCCCAILLPIVWSIRHLRQAAEADGKARDILARLTQFRQFYMIVVGYVYFTRIIVYLMSITLSYKLTWLGPLSSELATLAFFFVTGYKFRPTSENPYLQVKTEDDEDDEDEEFGLGDDEAGGVEMTATNQG